MTDDLTRTMTMPTSRVLELRTMFHAVMRACANMRTVSCVRVSEADAQDLRIFAKFIVMRIASEPIALTYPGDALFAMNGMPFVSDPDVAPGDFEVMP